MLPLLYLGPEVFKLRSAKKGEQQHAMVIVTYVRAPELAHPSQARPWPSADMTAGTVAGLATSTHSQGTFREHVPMAGTYLYSGIPSSLGEKRHSIKYPSCYCVCASCRGMGGVPSG